MSAITPGDDLTVITLTVGAQKLAIPACALREILDPLPVTRVPRAGPFVPGVVNVRGSVVPLANLRHALGIPDQGQDDRRRIMVLEVDLEGDLATVAIMADAVHEVTTVKAAQIEAAPVSATAWPADHISGLYNSPDGFVLIPDLTNIFAAQASRAADHP
ncbi:chemotaxis protein CheW [Paracoccus sp. T5]|uniref:chemotaxis protein CheW n=1 Tax=Paracoccus sp. T5 TaxID=3402161 RepID=UPI003AE8C447